jgi:hypothetical protein
MIGEKEGENGFAAGELRGLLFVSFLAYVALVLNNLKLNHNSIPGCLAGSSSLLLGLNALAVIAPSARAGGCFGQE